MSLLRFPMLSLLRFLMLSLLRFLMLCSSDARPSLQKAYFPRSNPSLPPRLSLPRAC
jgi:hypothetical protein